MATDAKGLGCEITITAPRLAGANLAADFVITCNSDRSLHYEALIKHHRRLLPDQTMASVADTQLMTKGQPFRGSLSGRCPGETSDYFSKLSIRAKPLASPEVIQTPRVMITCRKGD